MLFFGASLGPVPGRYHLKYSYQVYARKELLYRPVLIGLITSSLWVWREISSGWVLSFLARVWSQLLSFRTLALGHIFSLPSSASCPYFGRSLLCLKHVAEPLSKLTTSSKTTQAKKRQQDEWRSSTDQQWDILDWRWGIAARRSRKSGLIVDNLWKVDTLREF